MGSRAYSCGSVLSRVRWNRHRSNASTEPLLTAAAAVQRYIRQHQAPRVKGRREQQLGKVLVSWEESIGGWTSSDGTECTRRGRLDDLMLCASAR